MEKWIRDLGLNGTKKAEINVVWTDSFGELNTVSNNIYLTNLIKRINDYNRN
jgi:hypothetical protein